MMPRRAIFRRYALTLSAALAGIVLAYGLFEIAFATRENVQRIQDFHLSEARAFSGRVAFFFEEIERNFVSIASSPWGRGLGLGDRLGEYQRVMRLLPAVRDVTLADEKGEELLFASRTEPNREASRQRVERFATDAADAGKVRFATVRHELVGAAPIVTMGFRDRGEPARFTFATVNLQFVSDELAQMRRRGSEVAYMIDDAGQLVAHRDVSRPLKSEPANRALLDRIGVAREGATWTQGENGRVLAVWHRLENPPWTVIVETPWHEALVPVLATLYRTLAFTLAAILLALAASRYLADRMARPVVTLKEGAERLGRGELAHRIHLDTHDELEDLARDFNAMAEQLQRYTSGLEHLVDEKTAKLQEAMRARALFLAAASHDLRQPLYAISILADTLALEELDPRSRQTLEKQRQAIAILRGLFDNLLDLSRFDSGEVRASPRVFSLREILVPLAAEHEVVCRAKDLQWECDIADVAVNTDPELVRRLAANLLSNAIRYTLQGGVRFTARREAGRVVVEIADSGVGIAPEHQARVFDEFVQLDNPARDRDRGVGLGLSIVRKIDALLGTNLQLDSAPGKGTRMTFEIPVAEATAAIEPARDSAPTADLAGLRVWVVEDDTLVREALARQFAAWGVDAAFAAGRAEVEALRANDGGWPDAAILDDMLGPGERGLDIARWLAVSMPSARIVIVTGTAAQEALDAIESAGFRVLQKPLASGAIARWLHESARTGATTASRAAAPAG